MPPLADLWEGAAWRRAKVAADRVLVAAVAAAVAWAGVTAVFAVRRATTNRALAAVHLGGQPPTFTTLAGVRIPPSAHAAAGHATRTEIVRLHLVNDSPDGVDLGPVTLTGPFLTGTVRLAYQGNGYLIGGGDVQLRGRVTVDCAAAAAVTNAALGSTLTTGLPPTEVSFTATDANGRPHPTALVIDTTAYAVQSQVCRS